MKRNFGLDVYRSIAILMVLACHSLGFYFSNWFNTQPTVWLLGLGVEVFFALSGFLIGGILIRDVVEQPQPVSAPRKLFSFYLRRWLRTLPLYFLMVIVTLFYPQWPHFSLSVSVSRSTLLANLLFVQNFKQHWLDFQPVSWSLAIEEWFYLLVALGMVAISLVQRPRLRARLVLGFGVAVVLASLAYRGADFLLTGADWDIVMRQQIFMHMDALMVGVLAAWLRYYHRGLYDRLAHSRLFAALAVVVVVFVAYRYVYSPFFDPTIDDSLFAPTIGIMLLGVGLAALVMVFQAQLAEARWAPDWVVGAFEHISTRSYGYYLIHWPILMLLARVMAPGATLDTLMQHAAITVIALALTFLIANVVYLLYERPIMRLRDKIHFIPIPQMTTREDLSRLFSPAELQEAAALPVTEQMPRIRLMAGGQRSGDGA